MRFGIGCIPSSYRHYVDWVRTAEETGFHSVGTGDSSTLWADPFVTLTIAADGTITQEATAVHSANGIVVSNDGQILYAIETEDHRLIQFKIAPDASLSDRRVFLDLDKLTHHVGHIYPDGVKIDSKGLLYIGQNPRDVHAPLAGIIFVVDAAGTLLRTLQLPSPGVPNLALSPDEKTVYVMALDQLDKPPYQGKVYAIANR